MARSTTFFAWVSLAVAALQALFFVPMISGGGGDDVSVGGLLLFRIDGLSVVFGAVWVVALALTLLAERAMAIGVRVHAALLTVGLLLVAYAREPWVFAVGLEIAALGVSLPFISLLR